MLQKFLGKYVNNFQYFILQFIYHKPFFNLKFLDSNNKLQFEFTFLCNLTLQYCKFANQYEISKEMILFSIWKCGKSRVNLPSPESLYRSLDPPLEKRRNVILCVL